VRRINGIGNQIKFIVHETPAPNHTPLIAAEPLPPSWFAPAFDPADTKKVPGWIPLPEYANMFWCPLLGQTAWRVWEIVRRADRRAQKTDMTPQARFRIPQLARLVPCTQHTLTGRNLRCDPDAPGALQIAARGGKNLNSAPELIWARHLPGALEILEREGVAVIERSGNRKAAIVIISVLVSLPLLNPAQVNLLHPDLQESPARWVAEHGLDPAAWLPEN